MNDVALTGISLRCAGADNLSEFYHMLQQGKVAIGQPAEERIIHSDIPKRTNYFPYGYLNRVDQFDHEFFKISKAEANAISPAQRMLLQLVCEAIEDSGYSLEYVSQKKTALFVTTNLGFYNVMYHSPNPELDFVGGMPAMAAGRIAHLLNIRGPVFTIDTACSSALVAVHEALQKLKSGEVDLAIVGGSRLLFEFHDAQDLANGPILASDGMCRAFDTKATGTSGGEGVAAIVLKREADAVKDQDHIYAKLKGSAINHDGALSNGLTAPSPTAQRELLVDAASNANIPIQSVGYIETHGTGTKLGDPIEYKAIKEAFDPDGAAYSLRLGTLKPNIGHLDNMAGLFGLIKASLVLQHQTFFPMANFNQVNELISEDDRITLKKEGQDWAASSQETRRAGVSAFGLSGTNAHVILEEYQPATPTKPTKLPGQWLKFSARSKASLTAYIKEVKHEANQEASIRWADFVGTFNSGRSDHEYKLAVPFEQTSDLVKTLENTQQRVVTLEPVETYEKVAYLLLSDLLDPAEILPFQQIAHHARHADHLKGEPGAQSVVASQAVLYDYLKEKGFQVSHIIGNGPLAKQSKYTIEHQAYQDKPIELAQEPIDWEKFQQLLNALAKQKTALIVFGKNEESLSKLSEYAEAQGVPVIDALDHLRQSWEAFWSALYECGVVYNWTQFYQASPFQRQSVPTYPFQGISCWNERNPMLLSLSGLEEEAVNSTMPSESVEENASLEDTVIGMLRQTLEMEEFALTDDFFELGGNSIVGIQFINRVNDLYSISMEFDELYDCYEINDIITLIRERASEAEPAIAEVTKEAEARVRTVYPVTNTQLRFWIESQTPEGSAAYNINMNVRLKGEVNEAYLQKAVQQIIERHENFRMVFFVDDEGDVCQKILPANELPFEIGMEIIDNPAYLPQVIGQYYSQPFDLKNGPLIRVNLVHCNDGESILILSVHHLIFDGWSAGIFIEQLMGNYHQLWQTGELKSVPITSGYSQYLDWFIDNTGEEQLSIHQTYWKEKLAGELTKLSLGRTVALPTYRGKKTRYLIESDVRAQLAELAKKNRSTLFAVLMMSIRSYLYKLTHQNIVIGTPVSGRVRKEFEGLMGLFLNTLPLKTVLEENTSFMGGLSLEHQTITEALQHQLYPYDYILKDLNKNHEPGFSLFNVMVVLQNQNNRFDLSQGSEVELPIEIVGGVPVHDSLVQFDLSFTFYDNTHELELELSYSTDVFSEEMITSLMENYQFYLSQLLQHPEAPIQAIDWVRPDEKTQLLAFGKGVQKPIEATNYVELFASQVQKTPDKVAVRFAQESLTYLEVAQASDQLARVLRDQQGVQVKDIVAVSLERSQWLPVVVIGLFKLGATYLPIDPILKSGSSTF